jgi:hypothetical protein
MAFMKRIFVCLIFGFSLSQAQAQPQDFNANPTGALIVPNSDVIVFNQPPTGALQAPPVATGVLQANGGAATWFGLQPDQAAPSGYAPNGIIAQVPMGLPVTGYVDVYQGNALNRWVQIPPTDTGAPGGWVQWGLAGQPPQGLSVVGGN